MNQTGRDLWKKAHETEGEDGLERKQPVARGHPRATSPELVDKILYLRRTYWLVRQCVGECACCFVG